MTSKKQPSGNAFFARLPLRVILAGESAEDHGDVTQRQVHYVTDGNANYVAVFTDSDTATSYGQEIGCRFEIAVFHDIPTFLRFMESEADRGTTGMAIDPYRRAMKAVLVPMNDAIDTLRRALPDA
jgi:hypothetical protein